MNNSPTVGEPVQTASTTEPTVTAPVQEPTAETVNQETISHEQSQEAVSQTTAQTQTPNNGGGQNDDDGLAKFAKSQGFDLDTAGDDVKRALKIAHDNQKAYRNTTNEKKVTDAAAELNAPEAGESEDAKFRKEFQQFKYEQTTNKFWEAPGNDGQPVHNRALEPAMVEILNEKKELYGADYARTLSQDLPTLYGLAQLKSGAGNGSQVDTEAIRREERESIRQQQTASSGVAHAVTQNNGSTKLDRQWLETTYDPSNPEHIKLVDEATARGDFN